MESLREIPIHHFGQLFSCYLFLSGFFLYFSQGERALTGASLSLSLSSSRSFRIETSSLGDLPFDLLDLHHSVDHHRWSVHVQRADLHRRSLRSAHCSLQRLYRTGRSSNQIDRSTDRDARRECSSLQPRHSSLLFFKA